MNGPEALREFERQLIPVRSIAAEEEAWRAYRAEILPADLEPRLVACVDQGYGAGYSAAMEAVRQVLTRVQNKALGSRA